MNCAPAGLLKIISVMANTGMSLITFFSEKCIQTLLTMLFFTHLKADTAGQCKSATDSEEDATSFPLGKSRKQKKKEKKVTLKRNKAREASKNIPIDGKSKNRVESPPLPTPNRHEEKGHRFGDKTKRFDIASKL